MNVPNLNCEEVREKVSIVGLGGRRENILNTYL
jgi:hypothetical protein